MTPSIVMIAFAAVRVSNTRWSCSSKESNVTVELTGPPDATREYACLYSCGRGRNLGVARYRRSNSRINLGYPNPRGISR